MATLAPPRRPQPSTAASRSATIDLAELSWDLGLIASESTSPLAHSSSARRLFAPNPYLRPLQPWRQCEPHIRGSLRPPDDKFQQRKSRAPPAPVATPPASRPLPARLAPTLARPEQAM